jgi:macrolide transport system ATP-binding/permease protein
MRRLRAWFSRLGELFGRRRREQDFAAEMNSHLQLHIEDNLRAGMSPVEARREALMKLGGIEQTKENYRERRGLPLLEVFFQDLRFGARMLRKNPGGYAHTGAWNCRQLHDFQLRQRGPLHSAPCL